MAYGMSYQRAAGDPFLGGLLKAGIGFVAGGVKNLLGGAKKQAITGLAQQFPVVPGGTFPGGTVIRTPGVRGFVQRTLPGGATGLEVMRKRRRRMNPTNPQALRRAIRRQQGFVKLARKALQGTGYQIVTRGSRRPRRDLGPGHRHVR